MQSEENRPKLPTESGYYWMNVGDGLVPVHFSVTNQDAMTFGGRFFGSAKIIQVGPRIVLPATEERESQRQIT